ncbi:Putative fluoride ion transporter CrcB [Apilactobacillus kunkeei]|uniref:Fluoride-specific ion channel FluC n=1 Tax=Apilactobacillus kunkeei TaxID=148814 RepID=A0A1L8CH84_9LACO|nr:CrcB family protein [Apilactobacillus kunkeei]CAI2664685.1 Putative fluoride ion transporter CrcB [Apilactobacillus kunkeei]CAI2666509.1 Putative fluoride ion transporter CrcB [Apilactobacillus kunkeei]CAI2667273.1 Putative fluoride ion transporter CrcB [Apilactobacillus kunkeei]CAI2669528.1 Putative fluoride ion transporter CrcB [Apilactobacillus kunkeei]CAI2669740.1 Putative fluoride ion transporter CrcB [Apilactobacillus kunkeei]
MRRVIYIFILAFIGGLLRGYFTLLAGDDHFIATIIINLIGAFVLAFITGALPYLIEISNDLMTGLSIGLVGGFTTFSTFSFDSINLFLNHKIGIGLLYVLVSLIGGLILAQIGTKLGQNFENKEDQL